MKKKTRVITKKTSRLSKIKKITQKDIALKYFLEHIKNEAKQGLYEHGKKFLRNFKPSLHKGKEHTFLISLTRNFSRHPISVSLSTNIQNRQIPIFLANIRFTKGVVIVETLQGTAWLKEMREFESVIGVPSSRYLLREITAQAKRMGFDKVMLIDPLKHISYTQPHLMVLLDKEAKELQQKIIFDEATKADKKLFEAKKAEAIRIHQERMKKLYENVANGEGFVKKGNYYVKQLK
jgi:hypothetical protein